MTDDCADVDLALEGLMCSVWDYQEKKIPDAEMCVRIRKALLGQRAETFEWCVAKLRRDNIMYASESAKYIESVALELRKQANER